MVEIDDYFLQSSVSYYGLNVYVPHCSRITQIIKGRVPDLTDATKDQIEKLASSCKRLYGLLHQRFIITEDGIRKLMVKYTHGVYGKCPRIACRGQHLIPMGTSIELDQDIVKTWCPRCHDMYNCASDLDGAYFGPDLPIMFHKIANIPLRFKGQSKLLCKYETDEETVPEIAQRLYRWGEPVESHSP
jgi:casein kinase II subunit beta